MVYTRVEINAAIQRAAATGEPLTKDAYRAYRDHQGGTDSGLPSVATLT